MVIRGNESLIIVLLTRVGKSVLFILLALVEKWGTTVMIVLFVALIDNLVERAC